MCQLSPRGLWKIDPCMSTFVRLLNMYFRRPYKTISCCCGHGKYPMTLLVECNGAVLDFFSGEFIKRKSRFYKKDPQGFYYIPETLLKIKGDAR